MGVADEIDLLGKQVFSAAVETLDRLEREGLFAQARDLYQVLSSTNSLGDLTRALQAFQLPPGEIPTAPSILSLLREINKPETRMGMYRLVKMVQSLGNSPREKN
jgi:hypothetical protein